MLSGSPVASTALGATFGGWISAVDNYDCDLTGVVGIKNKAHCGRGEALEFRECPVAPPGDALKCSDPGVRWWVTLAGWLGELCRCGPDTKKASQLRTSCLLASQHAITSQALLMKSATRLKWSKALCALQAITKDSLHSLASAALDNATKGQRKAASIALESFCDWVCLMEKTKIGIVHKLVKEKPRCDAEVATGGKNAASPIEYMKMKGEGWRELWTNKNFNRQELFDSLKSLRCLCIKKPLPTISDEQLDRAIFKPESE